MSSKRLTPFERFIRQCLREDVGAGDVTSRSVIPSARRIRAEVITKQSGVVAGTALTRAIFLAMSRGIRCRIECHDGQRVRAGQAILRLDGPARAILAAERTALNSLGHFSGIATLTAEYVRRVKPHPVKILDTRKTIPSWRVQQKQAVKAGGGWNHRMGLDDAILIKTNHLKVLGQGRYARREALIPEAIARAKRRAPGRAIELEVATLAECRAALDAGVEMILLDNMRVADIRRAVQWRNQRPSPRPLLEVSGGVTLENVRQLAATGVDRISVGRLTHSAPALDVSLRVIE